MGRENAARGLPCGSSQPNPRARVWPRRLVSSGLVRGISPTMDGVTRELYTVRSEDLPVSALRWPSNS